MEEGRTRKKQPGGGAGGLGRYAGYGMAWVLAALLGGWAGLALDKWLGTSPALALLGALAGAGAGLYTLYARLVLEPAAKEKNRKE